MSIVVARESQTKVLSQEHYVSMVVQKVGEIKQQQLTKNQFHKPAIPLQATPFSTARTDTSEPFVSMQSCLLNKAEWNQKKTSIPTPGLPPAKKQVVTRKIEQKSKAAHKPPFNLIRRNSRL